MSYPPGVLEWIVFVDLPGGAVLGIVLNSFFLPYCSIPLAPVRKNPFI
jgi:hypothetical protein